MKRKGSPTDDGKPHQASNNKKPRWDHGTKPRPPPSQTQQDSKKRKGGPIGHEKPHNGSNKRPKLNPRAKQRDARHLSTQSSSDAFKNGELDVDKFVRARAYEIQALEQGLQGSKKALNRRAFQQVPKELRRRTASHNAKRVPKRLRERSKREMIEDHTPTVTSRRRKPTRHTRLRLETAKKLRVLGVKRRAEREKAKEEKVTINPPEALMVKPTETDTLAPDARPAPIQTRAPKVKIAKLAQPPVPKAKFRKRQKNKSWLPTYLFHAKRAHITPPSTPLWRFAIPLTPTAKSYRATHRASTERGAVAWDTSYMSTIKLEGQERSIIGMFKAFGVGSRDGKVDIWVQKGEKWRAGVRSLDTCLFEREPPHNLITPATISWCVPEPLNDRKLTVEPEKRKRKLILRVHPSSFFQVWEETVRLAKVAKPAISVEDLRFEIGSIEISGPGATEALLGGLWPSPRSADAAGSSDATVGKLLGDSVEVTWSSLAGLTNPALLPSAAQLAFNVQDPRLHHPPRAIRLPKTDGQQAQLLTTIAKWPVDTTQAAADIFYRKARDTASRQLPSQKAVNRRKALAPPGEYPAPQPDKDPRIPALLYTSTSVSGKSRHQQTRVSSWTLLAPWKCIQPIWYSLMYYPLSTGMQPRFGGLNEFRQVHFERGLPWFPADYPGTKAGWEWEVGERKKRLDEYQRRPKGKRIAWEKVELGDGKKGEAGRGWACDWELLLAESMIEKEKAGNESARAGDEQENGESAPTEKANKPPEEEKTSALLPEEELAGSKPPSLMQLSAAQAHALLTPGEATMQACTDMSGAVATVRITLLTRGVPQTCARIYRLPRSTVDSNLRKQWLALQPSNQANSKHDRKGSKHALLRLRKDAPEHEVQRRLAQSLLDPPNAAGHNHAGCPGEEDLIGFVTSGNFNQSEGQGTGVGNILISKVLETVKKDGNEGNLCIVRNAGQGAARLARWDIA